MRFRTLEEAGNWYRKLLRPGDTLEIDYQTPQGWRRRYAERDGKVLRDVTY